MVRVGAGSLPWKPHITWHDGYAMLEGLSDPPFIINRAFFMIDTIVQIDLNHFDSPLFDFV